MVDKTIRVGLVLTGDELVDGRVQDRNGGWLGARFTGLGCEVVKHQVIRDRSAELDQALSELASRRPRVDLIVFTGGQGSTPDDKTRQRIGRFTGRPLISDPALAAHLRRKAQQVPESAREAWFAAARKQAMVPEGAAVVMPVETGTAAAYVVLPSPERGGPIVAGLPGPPEEVKELFPGVLQTPPIRRLLAGMDPLQQRVIRLVPLAGSDETLLGRTETLARRALPIQALDVNICFAAGGAELNLVTTFPPSAQPAYDAFEDFVLRRHGPAVFSVEGQSVDEIVSMLAGDRTVGVLGTATGVGLISARIEACVATHSIGLDPSERAGATMSAVLARLGVAPAGARLDAAELAAGITEALGTDIGVGVAAAGEQELDVVLLDGGTGGQSRGTVACPDRDEQTGLRVTTEVMHLLRELLAGSSSGR
jgi:nicotinamide-nucleotide amidase